MGRKIMEIKNKHRLSLLFSEANNKMHSKKLINWKKIVKNANFKGKNQKSMRLKYYEKNSTVAIRSTALVTYWIEQTSPILPTQYDLF